jgi:hypothetical protein
MIIISCETGSGRHDSGRRRRSFRAAKGTQRADCLLDEASLGFPGRPLFQLDIKPRRAIARRVTTKPSRPLDECIGTPPSDLKMAMSGDECINSLEDTLLSEVCGPTADDVTQNLH